MPNLNKPSDREEDFDFIDMPQQQSNLHMQAFFQVSMQPKLLDPTNLNESEYLLQTANPNNKLNS